MKWTLDQVAELHRRYEDDELTLREIGKLQDPPISYERVGQLFREFGFPTRERGQEAAVKAQRHRREVETRADEIIAAYKRIGHVGETAQEFDLPYMLVADLIREHIKHPDREQYRRHGAPVPRVKEESISRDIRKAAKLCGEPLSVGCYRSVAPEKHLIAHATIVKFYSDFEYPWQQALEVAGVKGNPPSGRRNNGYTPEDCRGAVRQFINETGYRSYNRYVKWATDRDVPKGPTVRGKYNGSWAAATKDALESS